ncbi:MAG: ATP-binding protein, partial [Crocinitomicaceae bacterium]|nr:ATP-binding protein [Crocinitomicaceae bacterium]
FRDKYSEKNEQAIIVAHKKFDKNNKEIGLEPFLLDAQESEGTKKFFNLTGVFVNAIHHGRLVIIDEFDARFHTLLTKAILKIFNSENIRSEAQLLVASHDTALLDKRILRRDQICIVEKNQFGSTELTSLVEFKPRKESPYDKNYLDGKYGGIPMISDLEEIFKP